MADPPWAERPQATALESLDTLGPLIDRLGELERALGRVEEQRDAAIRERDELRAEIQLLRNDRSGGTAR